MSDSVWPHRWQPTRLPSLGFSRQEYWSMLPFPAPVHESEKWKWSRSVMADSLWPHGLSPTRLLCPWDFPGKSTGVGCHCLLQSDGRTTKLISKSSVFHVFSSFCLCSGRILSLNLFIYIFQQLYFISNSYLIFFCFSKCCLIVNFLLH